MRAFLYSLPLVAACSLGLPRLIDENEAFPVGDEPSALEAVDLNGDGALDLLVTNRSDDSVTVLENDGAGRFAEVDSFGVGAAPVALTLADLNNDGLQDLIVADSGDSTVSVLLGEAGGGFGAPANFATGGDPAQVAVAEFTNDGVLDVVTANRTGTVSVLTGNGDGTLQDPINSDAGVEPVTLLAIEFNAPPFDLLVADSGGDAILILSNDGTGAFDAPLVLLERDGSSPADLVASDFNEDGFLDAASADAGTGEITVFPNLDGASAIQFAAGLAPSSLALADFDGDGLDDLAFADGDPGEARFGLLFGAADFQDGAAQVFGLAATPGVLVSADFNGDGAPDLALTDPAGDQVILSLHNGL